MSKTNTSQHSSINKDAARWFIRMQDAPIDSPERTQFETWLMQSERHQVEYASIADAWNGIDSIDELKKLAAVKQANQFLKENQHRKQIQRALTVLSVCFVFVEICISC